MRRGKAERCQHQEEIILGNAQLDMLAGGMLRPLLRRGNLRLVKHVGQLLPTKQSPLVDECAEIGGLGHVRRGGDDAVSQFVRSEEHTSELQSLMRISYAVFCLKKKTRTKEYKNKLTYSI